MLVNTKAIAVGDELTVFLPSPKRAQDVYFPKSRLSRLRPF